MKIKQESRDRILYKRKLDQTINQLTVQGKTKYSKDKDWSKTQFLSNA